MAGDDQWAVHLTPDGQKAALDAVVGSRDVRAGSGWVGKTLKPKLHDDAECAGLDAKQSDLVLVGKAESLYTHKATGWEIRSMSSVLRTAKMVELDWKRTGAPSQFLKCLRPLFVKQSTAASRFVSLRQRPFPRIGKHTVAYRALFDVAAKSGKRVSVMLDMILASSGRTEITLMSTSAAAAAADVEPAEVRLVRALVERAAA